MFKVVFAALVISLGLIATPALAQSTKIFLSSTGSDSNSGSLQSPKRTFQAGHDAVATGGQLVVLDTAGYGPVSINKSISITVPPGVNGFVTVTTTGNGITINAGASSVVTLRGLIIEGPGTGGSAFGIYATSVGQLVIEDTIVRNFNEGIFVTVSSVSTLLFVRGGAVRGNTYGIDVESIGSAKLNAIVTDTELMANDTALYAGSGSVSVRLVATRCAINGGTSAFYVSGAGSQLVADGCTVSGVGTVFGSSVGGGTNYSRGNNTLFNNTTTGPFTVLSPQ